MKKIFLIITLLLFTGHLFAQKIQDISRKQILNSKNKKELRLPLFKAKRSGDFKINDLLKGLARSSVSTLTMVPKAYATSSSSLNAELTAKILKLPEATISFSNASYQNYVGQAKPILSFSFKQSISSPSYIRVMFDSKPSKYYDVTLEYTENIRTNCANMKLRIYLGTTMHEFPIKRGDNKHRFIYQTMRHYSDLVPLSSNSFYCNGQKVQGQFDGIIFKKVTIKELQN